LFLKEMLVLLRKWLCSLRDVCAFAPLNTGCLEQMHVLLKEMVVFFRVCMCSHVLLEKMNVFFKKMYVLPRKMIVPKKMFVLLKEMLVFLEEMLVLSKKRVVFIEKTFVLPRK
jgi:hypothetical protein